MSETPPYFYNPFGISADDLTSIPVTGVLNGPVSYEYGYGPYYELNLLTDPLALPIGRGTMNQLFFDITTLLQQYSQYGVPLFITTSQNQGTPFPYPIYARTYHGGIVYENQVASNTATPGTDNTWLVISGDSTGVLTGTILDFAGATVPAGYLACDNSAVLRTTYAPLLAVITQTQTGTTTNGVNTVTGLSDTSQMYVGMPLESANFASSTTVASIVSSTSITASSNATAGSSVSIRFFNWGNGDGSTTFNVPDFRRRTAVGQGGSGTSTLGNKIGQEGGEEAHTMTTGELVGHTHSIVTSNVNGGTGATAASPTVVSGSMNTNSTGSATPFNVIQPSAITYKIIKT
jgi:microcystin-dependent protein